MYEDVVVVLIFIGSMNVYYVSCLFCGFIFLYGVMFVVFIVRFVVVVRDLIVGIKVKFYIYRVGVFVGLVDSFNNVVWVNEDCGFIYCIYYCLYYGYIYGWLNISLF